MNVRFCACECSSMCRSAHCQMKIYIYIKNKQKFANNAQTRYMPSHRIARTNLQMYTKKETGLKKPFIHVNTIHLILQNFKVLLG